VLKIFVDDFEYKDGVILVDDHVGVENTLVDYYGTFAVMRYFHTDRFIVEKVYYNGEREKIIEKRFNFKIPYRHETKLFTGNRIGTVVARGEMSLYIDLDNFRTGYPFAGYFDVSDFPIGENIEKCIDVLVQISEFYRIDKESFLLLKEILLNTCDERLSKLIKRHGLQKTFEILEMSGFDVDVAEIALELV